MNKNERRPRTAIQGQAKTKGYWTFLRYTIAKVAVKARRGAE